LEVLLQLQTETGDMRGGFGTLRSKDSLQKSLAVSESEQDFSDLLEKAACGFFQHSVSC